MTDINTDATDFPPTMPAGAIIRDLAEVLKSPPFTSFDCSVRELRIKDLVERLYSTNVDPSALLKYGMRHLAAQAIIAACISAIVNGRGITESVPEQLEAWLQLLDLSSISQEQLEESDLEPLLVAMNKLDLWFLNAPTSNLVSMAVPTVTKFEDALRIPRTKEPLDHEYRWLYDRLGEDDIENWSMASIYSEFDWIIHRARSPWPDSIMNSVEHDSNTLARLIALDAIHSNSDTTDFAQLQLLSAITTKATHFISQSRFKEAAALFEFFENQHPGHAQALNNRGFCLMPIDQETSLFLLSKAKQRHYEPLAVNTCNTCVLYFESGQFEKLIDTAEYYWNNEKEDSPIPGILWDITSKGWSAYRENDTRIVIARLAANASERLSLSERQKIWENRLEECKASLPD
ncbi:hypothetical protein ACT17S_11540 [Glutamicibacter mysorens]